MDGMFFRSQMDVRSNELTEVVEQWDVSLERTVSFEDGWIFGSMNGMLLLFRSKMDVRVKQTLRQNVRGKDLLKNRKRVLSLKIKNTGTSSLSRGLLTGNPLTGNGTGSVTQLLVGVIFNG